MKALIVAFLLAMVITPIDLYARAVRYWYPDELSEKSSFVCDGLVLEVTPHIPSLISNMRLYSADIKVLAVLKGNPVSTLEFHYFRYEPWLTWLNVNGPCNVSLTKGGKYRFYLSKDSSDATYFGCLQGQFDDAQSVGPILVPNSANDARIRLNEVMKGWNDLERLFGAACQLDGKPGYEDARDRVVSKVLELVLMCESLKRADTDQKQVKATEDSYIKQLADWKDFLFSGSSDDAIFDKLIKDNLPDEAIRAYVIQHLVARWDHPQN